MGDNLGSSSTRGDGGGYSDELADQGAMKGQEMLLPIANVGRLMKQILPPNAKISKEAKETMQECVSEFISFVTGEASDKCRKERRKTVTGEDICWAMEALGLDDYSGPLRLYLQRLREFDAHHDNNNNHRAATSKYTTSQDQRPNGSRPF